MKQAIVVICLLVAAGAFIAAAFLGAVPAAARLNNVGLAFLTGAIGAEALVP